MGRRMRSSGRADRRKSVVVEGLRVKGDRDLSTGWGASSMRLARGVEGRREGIGVPTGEGR